MVESNLHKVCEEQLRLQVSALLVLCNLQLGSAGTIRPGIDHDLNEL